jgi:hypothetical protein
MGAYFKEDSMKHYDDVMQRSTLALFPVLKHLTIHINNILIRKPLKLDSDVYRFDNLEPYTLFLIFPLDFFTILASSYTFLSTNNQLSL